MARPNTTRAGAVIGTALVGLVVGAGLYCVDHDRPDGYRAALALEQNHKAWRTETSYGDDFYRDVAKELARVPVWSPDYRRARAWSMEIARARRVAAIHAYPQLGYPRRWERAPIQSEGRAPASDHTPQ